MPKGGARTRSGSPPDPDALRRERDVGEWVELPAAGRGGQAPAWPLTKATARERSLWTGLWKKPQAIMWDKLEQHLEVALYVRRLAEAEVHGSPVNLSTLVRQMSDSLGLTTPGMRANRWKIVGGSTTSAAETRGRQADAEQPRRPAARDRLRVVAGAGGA